MAESNEEDCVVAGLLETPFSSLSFQEKLEIIQKGRPSPSLPGLVQASKCYQRHFQTSSYSRYPWLTGSPRTNKLYCWDCLLFSPDKGPWSSTGFSNLSWLTKAALKHQSTPGHLRATVSLKTFGDTRIDLQLSEQQRRETIAHNEKVRQNREILKRLIHTVVFLGKQELPFRAAVGN